MRNICSLPRNNQRPTAVEPLGALCSSVVAYHTHILKSYLIHMLGRNVIKQSTMSDKGILRIQRICEAHSYLCMQKFVGRSEFTHIRACNEYVPSD